MSFRRYSVLLSLLCAIRVVAETAEPADKPDAVGPPFESPAGELTLSHALALALKQSPSLAAFSWDIRVAEAREIQARLRPNPALSLDIEDFRFQSGPGTTSERVGVNSPLSMETQTIPTPNGDLNIPVFRRSLLPELERTKESGSETGFAESEITLSLSQLIELGGKRAKRIAVAKGEQEVAKWDYEVARADVLASTAQAFYAVVAAQDRLELAIALTGLAQQVLDTVRARVDAGKVSAIELMRAEVEFGNVKLSAERAARELEAARILLAAHWGATSAAFDHAAGSFEELRALPPLDQLQTMVEQSPELARWVAEISLRDAAIALERANAKPDVTVSLGFRSTGLGDRNERVAGISPPADFSWSRSSIRPDDSRESSLVLGASVPLPLFNRNQGRIREAEYVASKAADQRRAAEVRLSSSLAAAYSLLEAAKTEYQTITGEILPKAQEAFDLTNEGYLQGKFGLLDMLTAQRALFDAQGQLLDAQSNYYQTTADIERFMGRALLESDESTSNQEKQP